MEEWKKVSLREVTDIIGDGLHGTPLYSSEGEFAFVNGNNLSDGAVEIKADTKMCDLSEYEKYKKDLSDRTLFLSINGTIGNTAKYNGEKIILGKSACYLNVKKDYNLDFIYYVLRTPAFQSAISGLATGTTIKNVSLKTIREYEFSVPDYEVQTRIARILRAIDDKIELNNRINHNLEQQVQALYKSWFIDFEPFKGGKFVDSELGMIPEGWRISPVVDLSQRVASGGTPKSMNDSYYSGNINWFTTKELKDCFLFSSEKKITEEAVNNSSAKLFPSGTLLMAIYAAPTVGRLGILASDSTFNQAAVGIIPRDDIGVEYLYLTLLSEREKLNNLSSGAAQQNLNVGIVKDYKVIEPDSNTLRMFNRTIKSIFNLIKVNSSENDRLIKSRDGLLQKLLSGELKINDLTC